MLVWFGRFEKSDAHSRQRRPGAGREKPASSSQKMLRAWRREEYDQVRLTVATPALSQR